MNFKVSAIIPAGGTSSRFGSKNKLLEKINGKEVIKYTVEAFEASNIDEIIICANKTIMEELNLIFANSPKVKITIYSIEQCPDVSIFLYIECRKKQIQFGSHPIDKQNQPFVCHP